MDRLLRGGIERRRVSSRRKKCSLFRKVTNQNTLLPPPNPNHHHYRHRHTHTQTIADVAVK